MCLGRSGVWCIKVFAQPLRCEEWDSDIYTQIHLSRSKLKFLSKILPSPDPSCQTSLKYSVILSQFKDNCSSPTVRSQCCQVQRKKKLSNWRLEWNKALSSYCCIGAGRLENIFNRTDQTGLDRSTIDCYNCSPTSLTSGVRAVW